MVLFQKPIYRLRMKRESGENPGQSRCCKLQIKKIA